MSTEIVRAATGAATLHEKMDYAKALATASLLPRSYQGNPGNVLLAIELGDALGVPPIQAITGIHVIEGKPSASSDLIASLVRRAGHKLRVSGDDQTATAQIIRADDPGFTYEAVWTMDRARTAGVAGKAVWKQYPAAMLKARAITEVARMGASDALYGVIYTPEELGEVEATVVPAATPVPSPRSGVSRLRAAVPPAERAEQPAPSAEPAPVEDVHDAEVVEAEPVDGITSQQLRKMGTLLRQASLTEREEALEFVAGVIGREVSSRNDLSKAEASAVIDALEVVTKPAPETAEHEQGEVEWPEVQQPGGAS